MSKTLTTIIIFAAALVIGVLVLAGTDMTEEGTIVFAVTDAAADMENITAVDMTVDGVDLRTEGGTWVRATSETETFSLLELNESGQLALLNQTAVDVGTYEGVRLHVSEVTVTTTDGNETNAVLASSEVVIDGQITVNPTMETNGENDSQTNESLTTVIFDVQADQSLHVTETEQTETSGEYIFAPVVEFTAQTDATVEIDDRDAEDANAFVVVSEEGSTTATVVVGVDEQGESRMNFVLDSSQGIEVNTDGSIELLGTENGTTSAESSDDTSTTTNQETEAGADVNVGDNTGDGVDAEADVEAETEVETETGLY